MKYKRQAPQVNVTGAPAASGALVSAAGTSAPQPATVVNAFYAWQPSTWPPAPVTLDAAFIRDLAYIFEESILGEIRNVIRDAQAGPEGLEHRGHVVAIGLLCALDAISSYGYGAKNGRQIPEFVHAHFPDEYKVHGRALLRLYRHAMVHSWNLFEASILPGDEAITVQNGTVSVGLLNFFDALGIATKSFLNELARDPELQRRTLARYRTLRRTARP